jgi:flagellar secretion chaperone FliS
MQNTSYFETKILTASPQRLHLMLIEGAIRFGQQASETLQRGDQVAAAGPLLRMIDIVAELLAGVRHSQTELNQKLARVYMFLFCRISEAKINADQQALAEVLELLEFERQTWQMACDKLSATGAAAPPAPMSNAFAAGRANTPKSGLSFQA